MTPDSTVKTLIFFFLPSPQQRCSLVVVCVKAEPPTSVERKRSPFSMPIVYRGLHRDIYLGVHWSHFDFPWSRSPNLVELGWWRRWEVREKGPSWYFFCLNPWNMNRCSFGNVMQPFSQLSTRDSFLVLPALQRWIRRHCLWFHSKVRPELTATELQLIPSSLEEKISDLVQRNLPIPTQNSNPLEYMWTCEMDHVESKALNRRQDWSSQC